MSSHPWSLVAPWYRWQRFPGVAARETPPVLQKYESSRLVEQLRANPQRSLRFTDEDTVAGRRKLFLAQHKRFYLVVCELHCDRRGFPNASAEDVCQAGFVLRRRYTPMADEVRKDATRLVQRISKRRAQIELIEGTVHARTGCGTPPRSAVAVAQVKQQVKRLAYAQQRLDTLHAELVQYAETNSLTPVLQGWSASEVEGVGTWSAIEDGVPQDGDEQVYPLFALIPDPKLSPHAARGRALYYGLVPTASSDTDPSGAPRLEPNVAYELQCFVRRHDPDCRRRPGNGRDCRGELTWSAPTESFMLASPQDLVGTSNRPVTVHLPDLTELLGQARTLPFGAGAPLKMHAPKDSVLPVVTDADGKVKGGSRTGDVQICSFAIPLITIVAFFVFRLFLPIVLLLFGLWPLLKLKFCIPPSVDLGLEVSAALTASRGGASADAGVIVKAKGDMTIALGRTIPANPPFVGMPGSGYDGHSFADMAADPPVGLPIGELLEVFEAQHRSADDPLFAFPALPEGALASPNSVLAPLIWEQDLPIPPIPQLEEAA